MSIARISSGDNCIAVSTQSSTIRLPSARSSGVCRYRLCCTFSRAFCREEWLAMNLPTASSP